MEPLALLRHLCGRTLSLVEGLFYFALGQTHPLLDQLDQLFLLFEGEKVRFRCAADGESLEIDQQDLFQINMAEHGDLMAFDLSMDEQFHDITGKAMIACFKVRQTESDKIIGLVLCFEGDGRLIICNWGDELRIWRRLPTDLFAAEGIEIVQ